MRMRKKRNGSERILACSDILVPKETEFTEILQMFGKQLLLIKTLFPIFILSKAAPAKGVVILLFSPILLSSNSLRIKSYSSVIGSVWLSLNNNFDCLNINSISSCEILSKSTLCILSKPIYFVVMYFFHHFH